MLSNFLRPGGRQEAKPKARLRVLLVWPQAPGWVKEPREQTSQGTFPLECLIWVMLSEHLLQRGDRLVFLMSVGPAELWQWLSISVLQHGRSAGRNPGRQGQCALPGAGEGRWRHQEGEISSVCLALSLLPCQGEGIAARLLPAPQNLPFNPLFLGAKRQCLVSSSSWDF